MKASPFKIPITSNESFLVQEDKLPYFYGILHVHPEVQITLILRSTGTLFAGDYIGAFRPGDIFIIGSNCPHVFKNDEKYYQGDSGLEAHAITIFLGRRLLNHQILEMPETERFTSFIQTAQSGLYTHLNQLPDLKDQMLKIRSEDGLPKLIRLFQIIQTLAAFGSFKRLLDSPLSIEVDESDGKRLKDIFEYSLQNYTRSISIQEIADIATLTPQSFCRFFRKSTRKTYVTFLTELRINKAKELLKSQGLSVSEISYQSGFNNLSHFNRQFHKLTGETPSGYRKRLKD